MGKIMRELELAGYNAAALVDEEKLSIALLLSLRG